MILIQLQLFFRSEPANIVRGLSINRACKVGMMTEDNIPATNLKNSYYCIYGMDMLKTSKREIKLFEFSRDLNKEDLRIRKNDGFAMASM